MSQITNQNHKISASAESENYPTTNEQYQQAFLRVRRRLENNENYSISANNCEHLVYHILTGHPFSSQVNEGSVVTRYFMDLIDDDDIKEMIKDIFIAGGSRIVSSMVYFLYIYGKITQSLEKESKRGIMNKLKDILVMYYKKIILGTSEKEVFSPVEKTLMSCLPIDPFTVSKSQEAITKIRKAALHYRSTIMFVTVALTSTAVIIHTIIKIKSLNKQRRNGIINPRDCNIVIEKKEKSIISSITIFLLIMCYFRRDYTNTWTVLLETSSVMILRHFMSPFINIVSSYI